MSVELWHDTAGAAARAAIVAPLALARVAGLEARTLERLTLPRTVAAIEALDAAEASVAAAAEPLAAALHALVPTVDGRERRHALALKRDVHNAREPSLPPADLEPLRMRLHGRLAAWEGARASHARALAAAERALAEETAAVDAVLRDAALELLPGLALASPALASTLSKPGPAAAREVRSLTAYVTRAAAKTSPFSTFTLVGAAGFGTAPDARTGAVVTLAPAVASTLLLACAGDERLAAAFDYAAAEPLGEALVVPRRGAINGFLWRHDRLSHGRDCASYPSLARRVRTGLARPVEPWTRGEARPLQRLADRIADEEIARAVTTVDAGAQAVADAPGSARPALVQRLRTDISGALSTVGAQPPAWLVDAPLVHEDVALARPLALAPAVGDALVELGAVLRPHIVRSRAYDLLVDAFVARHGAGGRATDVGAFLAEVERHGDWAVRASSTVASDVRAAATADRRRAHAPVSPTSAPPTASVFFQVAASTPDAIDRGDFLLVLNQLNPGVGALLARHAPLLGPAVERAVADWLGDLHPGAELIEVPVSADWNSLQAPLPALLPALRWPGEAPRSGAVTVGLDELVLEHDAREGTLTLRRAGRALAPVYLGTVPPHLVSGALRVLLTLGNPWMLGDPTRHAAATATPERVEAVARAQQGRLVLRRAHWRVPPGEFPVRGAREAPLAFLRRVRAFQAAHELPAEVFMTVERSGMTHSARARKPMWVRFDSLHALEAAARSVDADALAVQLTEALPGPGERWAIPPATGASRVAEFVSLLRWER